MKRKISPNLGKRHQRRNKTGVKDKILALLADKTQDGVSAPDLVRETGAGINTVRRALAALYKQGLIKREQGSHAMLYSARPDNAALPLFRAYTTVRMLEPLVKKLRHQTDRIVLYGPCSRGTDTAGSDINLFIIAHNPTLILNITEPYRLNGRKILTIINTPGHEVTIKTTDPALVGAIEAGLVLWQDPSRPVPLLVAGGAGRHKIAISTTWLKWKRSADPGRTSEPYVISMAFDSHTFKGEKIEPFFNALPFPNVLAGDTVPMLGEGHFFYGPREPGAFVALSIIWMEKDAGARNLGQTISDLQGNKKVKKGLAAITDLAGEGIAKLMPGLQAVTAIVAEALKLNRDDEIFRTDGVYVRTSEPPFLTGSETVLGNVFMDFNVKIMDMAD